MACEAAGSSCGTHTQGRHPSCPGGRAGWGGWASGPCPLACSCHGPPSPSGVLSGSFPPAGAGTEPGTGWATGVATWNLTGNLLPPPVCRTAGTKPLGNPFACMDLTYVSLLLQQFGFPESKVLQVRAALGVPLCPAGSGEPDAADSLPIRPHCPILSFQADSENRQCGDQLGPGGLSSSHRVPGQTEASDLVVAVLPPPSPQGGGSSSLGTGPSGVPPCHEEATARA